MSALLCTTALGLTLPMGLARAQSVSWNGGAGDWNTGTNWNPGVPTGAEGVFFINGGTAEINSGTNAEALLLSLDPSGGTSANLTIHAGGGLALTHNLSVGNGTAAALLDIDGGTLIQTIGGTAWISAAGRLVLRNGGMIDVSDNGNGGALGIDGGTLVIGDGGGDVLATSIWGSGSPGQVIFDNSDNSVFSTLIEDLIDVVHDGSGTTTLSRVNSYTGGTRFNAGVLSVSQNVNLGAASGTLTFDGGSLQTTAGFSMNRATSIDAGGGTFDVDSGTLSQAGVISGSGTLNKTGAGTLTLTGNSSGFSGTTTVSEGTLRLQGLLGGSKNASGTSVIEAATANAFSAGSNSLFGSSTLNALTADAITGGVLAAHQGATINALAANAISGGSMRFLNASTLNASVAGAISGGTQEFQYTARLSASAAGAVSGGVQQFLGYSVLDVLADNALTTATDIRFSETSNPILQPGSGMVRLNGHSTTIGQISSETSGAGIITNDGASNSFLLVDTSAGASEFSGVIKDGTGAGRLGLTLLAGDLTLSGGSNTYSGGTIVNGGTLTAGAAGAFVADTDYTVNVGTLDLNGHDLTMASLSGTGGTLALGAADLTVDQIVSTTFAGLLSGTGAFTKSGAGNLTLTGDSSTFGGHTVVNGGILVVGTSAGGALGGALTIGAGGLLGGTGTIGSTGKSITIDTGASHAPGNSIGVQHIAGDYVNHGTLIIEATPTAADKIVVAGDVDITGASLQLLLSPTDAASWDIFNGPFTIIDKQSAGMVTGTFDPVTKNLLFLDAVLDYAGGDGNDVTLRLERNNVSFAQIGTTPNQIATGTAVDALGNANAVWRAIALAGDAEVVRAGFDALSGEIYASARTAQIEDSRFVRNAAIDRLLGGEAGIWSQAFAGRGTIDGDGNAAGTGKASGGLLLGADADLSGAWRLGLLAGYGQTNIDAADRASSLASDNYHLGLYGGTGQDDLAFRFGAFYSAHDMGSRRSISVPGFSDALTAGHLASTTQVFGELGYGIEAGAMRFEPFANLAYVHVHSGGLTESGGAAALSAAAGNMGMAFTTLGLRAEAAFDMGEMPVSASAMVGWRHAAGDGSPTRSMAFAGGGSFAIEGAPVARDVAIVEAGLNLALSANARLGLSYGGQFGSGMAGQSVQVDFTVKF